MQLIHGDCLEEMEKIPDKSVDMILCDLPYGTTACSWDVVIPFEPLWGQYKRIIKRNNPILLFGSQPFTTWLVMSNFDSFQYELIWNKGIPGNIFLKDYQPLKIHENILVFGYGNRIKYNPQMSKRKDVRFYLDCYGGGDAFGKKGTGGIVHQLSHKYPTSIISETNALRKGIKHPTQKPIPLLEYLIKTYTNEGDLVLDNCMGSGSTGIACLNTNRDFIGIELYPLPDKPISKTNPDYFNIAKNRIAKWKFEPTEDSKEEQINLF